MPSDDILNVPVVIDAEPCTVCGELTLSILEIAGQAVDVDGIGAVHFERFMCRPCQGPALADADRLRGIFEGLLASGVSRARANEIMIRWHVRPKSTHGVQSLI